MFCLQSVNRFEHLLDLIRLCLALVALNVHPRVTLPRCLVDPVAGSPLPRLAKEVVTDLAEVAETHAPGIVANACEELLNTRRVL